MWGWKLGEGELVYINSERPSADNWRLLSMVMGFIIKINKRNEKADEYMWGAFLEFSDVIRIILIFWIFLME